jgi:glycine cleavage system H lipoate-binding protein
LLTQGIIQDASKGFSQSESVKSLQTFMSHVSRDVVTVLSKIDEEMADLNSQNATALSKIEKMSKDMAEKVGKLVS